MPSRCPGRKPRSCGSRAVVFASGNYSGIRRGKGLGEISLKENCSIFKAFQEKSGESDRGESQEVVTEERELCAAGWAVSSHRCPLALDQPRVCQEGITIRSSGLEIPISSYTFCCTHTQTLSCFPSKHWLKILHIAIVFVIFQQREITLAFVISHHKIPFISWSASPWEKRVRGNKIEQEKISLTNLMSFLCSRGSHPIIGRLSKQRLHLWNTHSQLGWNTYLKMEELGFLKSTLYVPYWFYPHSRFSSLQESMCRSYNTKSLPRHYTQSWT